MSKILVTGGAGFIGHHFVKHVFTQTDWAVVVLDRIDHAGDFNRLTPDPRLAVVHHDLRAEINPRVGERLLTGRGRFDASPFRYVVHMAAGSHVDRSVREPIEFVLDNVLGTARLFEWLRQGGVLRSDGRVIYFSTDEVFGPAGSFDDFEPYDRFNPNNPYAATKAAAECLVPAWVNTYGLPIITTHCTNVFGEGQDREKFIPMTIDNVRRGKTVYIHADKDHVPSSRFYLHADNVSTALMLLLDWKKVEPGTKWNICGDEELSNRDVAKRIATRLNLPLKYELVSFAAGRPKHDQRYVVNSGALRNLGWKPHVSFDEGLARLIPDRDRSWEDT